MAQKTSNEVENIKKIFKEIFLLEVNDALRYDLDSFDVHSITEFKAYQGVSVSIVAYLDRTKILISIDIGFGDIVYPARVLMDFLMMLLGKVDGILLLRRKRQWNRWILELLWIG